MTSSVSPSDRDDKAARIFAEAVELPREQRAQFLRDACAGEQALHEELAKLLAAHDTLSSDTDRMEFLAQLDVPRALTMMSESAAELIPGATIGPYRLVRELGQGGMGTVYLAERGDGGSREQVALKVVLPWVLMDPLAVKRFEAERRILEALDHPGLVRLLDNGVNADGRPWFAMEYLAGLRIDKFANANNLTSTARLALFTRVCDVVHYAHTRSIVHRDLKPANILVSSAGEVKLLDFGIAKLIADSGGLTIQSLTRKGARPMTLDYASPEQVLSKPVSPASDVYSLGVVLYVLLTGRHPYLSSAVPFSDRPRRIVMQEAEPPSMIGAAMHDLDVAPREIVDRIVLKALRKAPDERYPTAGELAAALRRGPIDLRP